MCHVRRGSTASAAGADAGVERAGALGGDGRAAEREVLEHNPEDPIVLRIPILMGNSPSGQRSVHEKLIAAIGIDTAEDGPFKV